MHYFVGIDPGVQGAVAVLDEKGRVVSIQDVYTEVVKSGKKKKHVYLEAQMSAHLSTFAELTMMVALENVHAMPKQGVASMFSLGVGLGLWRGIIAALRMPVTMVEPATWKATVGIARGSEKAASIVRACQLFPAASERLTRVKDDGRADALLLAEHARRQFHGPRQAKNTRRKAPTDS